MYSLQKESSDHSDPLAFPNKHIEQDGITKSLDTRVCVTMPSVEIHASHARGSRLSFRLVYTARPVGKILHKRQTKRLVLAGNRGGGETTGLLDVSQGCWFVGRLVDDAKKKNVRLLSPHAPSRTYAPQLAKERRFIARVFRLATSGTRSR